MNNNDNDQLLPCPFCSDGGDVWQPARLEVIRCSSCGAEGPRGKTDDEIVRLWNARATAEQMKNEVVDEVQRRMDAVVEAAVEWHQACGENNEWFEKAGTLACAIDSLLALRDKPALQQVEVK
jgi:hypothetical protein